MIPAEAVTLNESVDEILERRLGDYIHDSLPHYGMDRIDKVRGMLYVALLVGITAVAGFFLGRESLRHYPDPVPSPAPATTIQLLIPAEPLAPEVPQTTEIPPNLWPR